MKSLISRFISERKRKKHLPVLAVCRNCGTPLVSHYCHNCGQYLFAGFNYSIKDIIYNAFDTVFAWDNKLFRTIKYLLFVPGKLTKEYLSGKVINYVPPAKLFWFITIIFFAVITFWAGEHDGFDRTLFGNLKSPQNIETTGENNTNSQENRTNQKEEITNPDKKQGEKEKKVTLGNLINYFPYGMFFVVPLFALLLQVFFFKKQQYYAGHLVFALHLHAFVFLLFTMLSLINFYLPHANKVTNALFLYIPPLYFIIALFVVYRPKIWSVIWKVPIIMFTYGIAVFAVLLFFSLFIIQYMYNVNVFDRLGQP